MKKRVYLRILSSMLVIVMLFSQFAGITIAAESPKIFPDISGHYAENVINEWAELGFISGNPDGTFAPTRHVTRAEFVVMFNKAFSPQASDGTSIAFSDIAINDWYYEDVMLAAKAGIISGYPSGRFGANDPITRQDACVIVSRYLSLTDVFDKTYIDKFSDKTDVATYALDHVTSLSELKIINGTPTGVFMPTANITRADSLIILNNAYNIVSGGSGITGKIYNNNKSLSEATITVLKKDDYVTVTTITTDNEGRYSVNLSAGEYDILVSKDKVVNYKSAIMVRSGYKSFVKVSTEEGQEISTTLKDINGKVLADTTIYFKTNPYFSAVSDSKGIVSTSLPKNRDYEMFYIKDGVLVSVGKISTKDLASGNVSTGLTAGTGGGSSSNSGSSGNNQSTYKLTISSSTGGSISTGTSGNYASGTNIPLVAMPNEGYKFVNWISSNGGSFANADSSNTTFTMPTNATTITAVFAILPSGDNDYTDSDFDDLTDYNEINVYHTNPNLADTDGDGVDDGWEVFYGTDPLVAQGSFNQTKNTGIPDENDPVTASVSIELTGNQVGSLEVTPVTVADELLLSPAIPGYLGVAYDFSVDGSFSSAKISFNYDTNLGIIGSEFQPRIYYLDEGTGLLSELPNQTVENGKVTATVSHFSKYILLNSVEFNTVWLTDIRPPRPDDGSGDIVYENLDVVFVIDESNSMENNKSGENNDPNRIRVEAAKLFIDEMEQGKDRAGIIGFSDNPRKLTGSSDISIHDVLQDDLDSVKTAADMVAGNIGGTQLYKGLNLAIDQLQNGGRDNAEKVIIALTDGEDDPSAPAGAYDEVVAKARESGITVYTIGLGDSVATILLTYIAETTGGKYFHADEADDVYKGYELVKDETVDYNKDSNGDGISDYYSKLIFEGKLRIQNGSGEFIGTDFESNVADIDGDGLLNGEEISVLELNGGRVIVIMNSDPVLPDTDFDGYGDKTDIHPLQPDYFSDDISDFRFLTENGKFQYSVEASNFDENTWKLIGDATVAALSFTDLQQEYTMQMVDTFNLSATDEYINLITMSEMENAIKGGTYEAIGFYIEEAKKYLGGGDALVNIEKLTENGLNILTQKQHLADAIAAGKSSKSIAAYKGWVTRHVNMFKNGEVPALKMYTKGLPDKLSKNIIKTAKGVEISAKIVGWTSVCYNVYSAFSEQNDIWNLATGIASENANIQIFTQNADVIIELRDNGNREFTRCAAQFILDSMSESYLSVRKQMIDHAVLNGSELVLDIMLLCVPQLWVVGIAKGVFDVCNAIWGWSDTVITRARIICINDMTEATNRFVNMYYLTFNEQNLGRHLKNLTILRIVGEDNYIKLYDDKSPECAVAANNISKVKAITLKMGLL